MIKDNDRIIIVFGMARSGTTVFTHVLSQHYKIYNFHNVYNYENDLIFDKNWQEMEKIVGQWPNKKVLFKRPWSEQLVDFYLEHMPDAHYIAMLKPFEMINKSWQKSHWTRKLWQDTDEERRHKYDHHVSLLDEYRGKVKIKTVDYPKFASQPEQVMDEVCDFLGLLSYRRLGKAFKPAFDTSMVKPGGDWGFLKN